MTSTAPIDLRDLTADFPGSCSVLGSAWAIDSFVGGSDRQRLPNAEPDPIEGAWRELEYRVCTWPAERETPRAHAGASLDDLVFGVQIHQVKRKPHERRLD